MADTATARRALSPAQSQYIRDLLSKITSEPVREALRADLNTLRVNGLLDTREASRQIDRLKAVVQAQAIDAAAAPDPGTVTPATPFGTTTVTMASPAPVRQPYPVVAAGCYAVEIDGVLRFYRVTKSDDGSRTFAKRYVSDSLVRIHAGEQVRALRLIEADVQTAQMTYARETTRCFTCGRRLTDPESMERGQGPDCAGR